MPVLCPDLWGVHEKLDAIRANSLLPQFVSWREGLLAALSAPTHEELHTARELSERAQSAAMAHLLTGEGRYLEAARQALGRLESGDLSEGWLAHGEMYPEDRADLITAEVTKACSNAVSWLWPALSEDERSRAIQMLAERGGAAIYHSATAGCWWGNALNSNWTAVLNSGLGFAALMLGSIDPDRAAPWLAFARNRIVEMLDVAAEEAAGVEGAGYWLYCFGSAQDFVEALRNVTGEDLYAHPFWAQASRFMPYLALPDFSAWANYADTGYRGLGGSAFFHGLAARKQDALAQWYAGRILERHGGAGWRNVIYYDPAVPEQPITREPTCRLFRSIHLASMRSSWDEDAVFMLFKGGSNAWSHTHLDLNSFFITGHGERLATEPGPDSYSLAYWHSIEPAVSTAWHNCIVVDGAHQRVPAQYAMTYDLEEAGDCYSRLSDYLCSDEIVMLRGDASSAYGDSLERAWRDVVYLKPGVFVIHDDLLAHPVRTQRNFEWMLHSECPLSDVEVGIEARGERGRLLIQPLFPEGWEHKYITGRTIPKAGHKPLHAVSVRPYWHHKWNVDPWRSPYPHWHPQGDAEPLFTNDCRYLVVLSVIPEGQDAPFRSEPLSVGSARGVRLSSERETCVVLFNHGGERLSVAGVETDAEKAVVRNGPDGVHWAIIRGTYLSWQCEELFRGQAATDRVG